MQVRRLRFFGSSSGTGDTFAEGAAEAPKNGVTAREVPEVEVKPHPKFSVPATIL